MIARAIEILIVSMLRLHCADYIAQNSPPHLSSRALISDPALSPESFSKPCSVIRIGSTLMPLLGPETCNVHTAWCLVRLRHVETALHGARLGWIPEATCMQLSLFAPSCMDPMLDISAPAELSGFMDITHRPDLDDICTPQLGGMLPILGPRNFLNAIARLPILDAGLDSCPPSAPS